MTQLSSFLKQHPVFRYKELQDFLGQNKAYKSTTLKALIQYHLNKKHIVRIRRGYYAREDVSNSILIAGHVSQDAIIAYHSALSFHGMAYSILDDVFYLTNETIKAFTFDQVTYHGIIHPKALSLNDIFNETKKHDVQGVDVYITTPERTLVDCLHKPQFAGGLEEIWHAADMVNFLDVGRMENYALRINNATTCAKLGFYLEEHQQQLRVPENILERLEKYKPKGVHYMTHESAENKYIKRWNLMVPVFIKNKMWEEPNNDI